MNEPWKPIKPPSTGQKAQNVNKLRLTTIEVEQGLAKQVKPCAKDAFRFTPMLFDEDGLMFHHPFTDSMCPAKCQGQQCDELLQAVMVFKVSRLQTKAASFQAAKQGFNAPTTGIVSDGSRGGMVCGNP